MQNAPESAPKAGKVDRDLAIPLGQQIRAHLIQEISSGRLTIGAPLPSVRDLAESLGVSTVTVAKTYAELKTEGLVAAQVGSGTYITDSPLARLGAQHGMAPILAEMDGLIDRALDAGFGLSDLTALFNARAVHRLGATARPRVYMVGLFEAATRSYAQRLTEQLGPEIAVTPLVLGGDDPRAEAAAAEALRSADMIVTFASLRDRLRKLAPDRPVVAIRFIPAETTRMALAAIDPMARMVVVSWLPDFLPVLELGVRRFAPHVQEVAAVVMDDPDLPRLVAECDVLVLATGAEAVAEMAPPRAARIEYLHMPDPGDVARVVRPHIHSGPAPAGTDTIQESKEAS